MSKSLQQRVEDLEKNVKVQYEINNRLVSIVGKQTQDIDKLSSLVLQMAPVLLKNKEKSCKKK